MISPHRFSVAPMIDWTDRHCRYFHRLITRHALLYTEMIVGEAILQGDRDYLLKFDPAEHPVALQIGGSNPKRLREAAKIGVDYGYDEINLNVGCPSDRVQSGTFGACLMKEPDLVAECIAAMREAVSVPVTVKSRIGVDDQEPAEALFEFVEKVSATGCETFIVHARKAWLKGLSPKENRMIPPLDYGIVAEVKKAYPNLTIILNGGIQTIEQSETHLKKFDGVMLGRAAYEKPWILHEVDRIIFDQEPVLQARQEVVLQIEGYIEAHLAQGGKLAQITRHMLGLFHGMPGARRWRQILTVEGSKPDATFAVVEKALNAMLELADAG